MSRRVPGHPAAAASDLVGLGGAGVLHLWRALREMLMRAEGPGGRQGSSRTGQGGGSV